MYILEKISGSVRFEAEWWPTGERPFFLCDAPQEECPLRRVGIAAASAGACQVFIAEGA